MRRLLPQFPDEDRPTEQHAMLTWWANIREEGGMRLTRHGYDMLHRVLKMESWRVEVPSDNMIGKRQILDMDHKLTWPYYIKGWSRTKQIEIIFFSSREAMMASLYGDIKQWLANK